MESKTCSRCRITKPFQHFQLIIQRQTYAPGTEDDDGYEYFIKETKACMACRERTYASNIRFRRRKYPDPPNVDDIKK